MRSQNQRIYEFADFRVEMAECVLKRNGQAVPLRPKLFELLVFLLEHRGVILEKEEITRIVWGSFSQGSAEQPTANLTVNISNLRQALGDDSDKPLFIETIPHRGYRFIALVRVIEAPQAKPAEAQLSTISAASGGNHQVFSSVAETAAEKVTPLWPESATGSKSGPASVGEFDLRSAVTAGEGSLPDQNQNNASLVARKTVITALSSSRWRLIAALIVLVVIATWLIWAMGGLDGRSQSEMAGSSANRMGKQPLSGSADLRGNAGSQAQNSVAIVPQIDSIEPSMPSAWIGDKPIKVIGSGFQAGLSVTMLFPGGGSGTLSGVAVLNVTPNEFILLADFNNNPGEYRIRINSPEGLNSNWWVFDVFPINLLPEITEVKQVGAANGKQRIAVTGRNFLQSVSAMLVYPDGQKEYLQASRVSANDFYLLFDPRGQTGPFRLQAQNSGKGSNVVSFSISAP